MGSYPQNSLHTMFLKSKSNQTKLTNHPDQITVPLLLLQGISSNTLNSRFRTYLHSAKVTSLVYDSFRAYGCSPPGNSVHGIL